MGAPGAFTPDFALVAYAEVAADGSSTQMNSGISTTRTTQGTYKMTLPTNLQQLDRLSQIYVQPKTTAPLMSCVIDTDDQNKLALFASSSTILVDTGFSVFIWRSTITPPAGSPS